ncbi:hypothetical protein YC2023_109957 [Brassica napus]
MCSVVASQSRKKICYVHYPQRFDGIGIHDIYSNSNVVFFYLHWKQKEQSHRCWSFARATEESFKEHLKVEPTDPKQGFLDFCYPPRQRDISYDKKCIDIDTSENQICWDPWHQMQRILLEYWLKFTGNKMGWDRWQ